MASLSLRVAVLAFALSVPSEGFLYKRANSTFTVPVPDVLAKRAAQSADQSQDVIQAADDNTVPEQQQLLSAAASGVVSSAPVLANSVGLSGIPALSGMSASVLPFKIPNPLANLPNPFKRIFGGGGKQSSTTSAPSADDTTTTAPVGTTVTAAPAAASNATPNATSAPSNSTDVPVNETVAGPINATFNYTNSTTNATFMAGGWSKAGVVDCHACAYQFQRSRGCEYLESSFASVGKVVQLPMPVACRRCGNEVAVLCAQVASDQMSRGKEMVASKPQTDGVDAKFQEELDKRTDELVNTLNTLPADTLRRVIDAVKVGEHA